jgi:hypothetical protein
MIVLYTYVHNNKKKNHHECTGFPHESKLCCTRSLSVLIISPTILNLVELTILGLDCGAGQKNI